MNKNSKCINIFEQNKKNLNLYQISVLIILLITSIQIGINSIKYTQLNDYISKYSYKNNPQKEVNKDSSNENSYTQKFNTNFSKLKEVSSIIGMKKIQSIDFSANKVEIQGYCEDMKVLKKISNLENIKDFDIKNIQKNDNSNQYFFDIEYKLGGKN